MDSISSQIVVLEVCPVAASVIMQFVMMMGTSSCVSVTFCLPTRTLIGRITQSISHQFYDLFIVFFDIFCFGSCDSSERSHSRERLGGVTGEERETGNMGIWAKPGELARIWASGSYFSYSCTSFLEAMSGGQFYGCPGRF